MAGGCIEKHRWIRQILTHLPSYYLAGGIPTPLKNDGVKVTWDDDIPNMMGKSSSQCLKPPTRCGY
jgi:hypothetical protein